MLFAKRDADGTWQLRYVWTDDNWATASKIGSKADQAGWSCRWTQAGIPFHVLDPDGILEGISRRTEHRNGGVELMEHLAWREVLWNTR